MEKQLDELLTKVAVHIRKLVGKAESVSVSLTICEGQLDWSVDIEESDEDTNGYSRTKRLPPA